jgi:hypothetical protein
MQNALKLTVEFSKMYYTKIAPVVQWSEFLAKDQEVPDSIHGTVRFSEKYWVWNGVHSTS